MTCCIIDYCRWLLCFDQAYPVHILDFSNFNFNLNCNIYPTSPGLTQSFTVKEIANLTKSQQKRKSPDHDNLVSEHILNAFQPVNEALAMLFNSVVIYERIPVAWKTSVVITIYKVKGKSKTDPNSYRPISLIPVLWKSHFKQNQFPSFKQSHPVSQLTTTWFSERSKLHYSL